MAAVAAMETQLAIIPRAVKTWLFIWQEQLTKKFGWTI
jgi:hypothetical protein